MLECAVQHCLRAKVELVSAYVLAYATESNEMNKKNDEVMFSNSAFKTLVETTQNYSVEFVGRLKLLWNQPKHQVSKKRLLLEVRDQ